MIKPSFYRKDSVFDDDSEQESIVGSLFKLLYKWFMRWRIRIKSKILSVVSLVLFLYIIITTLPSQQSGQVKENRMHHHMQNSRGRCGYKFPTVSGAPSRCNESSTCCSAKGWCSNDPEDCLCEDCIYYEWEDIVELLPENPPMDDDNSYPSLNGYQYFLLEPEIDCTRHIIIPVYSAVNNFRYRQMIRLTWGSQKYLDQVNASLIFIVGRYPNLKIQTRLEQESIRYKDILQSDILEDYFLLGFKSLSWLHWTNRKCSQIPWIVKTDDDMVNNILKMGALVKAVEHQRNVITCSTKTEKVIREKTGTRIDKWVIPFDEWADEYFPTNCWGVVYIFSSYVRDKILEVYEKSNGAIFRIDDVFVTGILAERANVTHRDIGDVITFYEGWDEDIMLSGNVWFGHIPPDNENLHKRRYWLWKRMENNL